MGPEIASAGGGRVLAWGDEWLTYDTVWDSLSSCDQADVFWENTVRWLGYCK